MTLQQAIDTLPTPLLEGEYARKAKWNEDGDMFYCTIGWLLHCAGVDDATLISLTGNIADDPEYFPRQDLVELLFTTYGLTKDDLRLIEEINDHCSRKVLDACLQMLLEMKRETKEEREIA